MGLVTLKAVLIISVLLMREMVGVILKTNKSQCTSMTKGNIVNLENKGLNFPTLITVEYVVNSNTYRITESLKLKSETIKLWFIPIGQRKIPVLPKVAVGEMVVVNYNPNEPTEAYLADNIGIANC